MSSGQGLGVARANLQRPNACRLDDDRDVVSNTDGMPMMGGN